MTSIFETYKAHGIKLTSGEFQPFYDVEKKKLNKNFKFNTNDWKNAPKFDKKATAHALLTGKTSNITAIDIDDILKEHNIKFIEILNKNCNMIQRTKKGYHFIFKYTDKLRTTTNTRLAIDIRNDNALLYAEPSYYIYENTKYSYEFITKPKEGEEIKEINDEVLNYYFGLHKIDETKKPLKIKETNKDALKETKNLKIDVKIEDKNLKFILDNLNNDRFDNFQDWIKLGIILKKININNSNIYEEYSKKSEKYTEGEPHDIFNSLDISKYDININTLYYWLKVDNKEKFNELMTQGDEQYLKMKLEIEQKYFLVGSKFYKKLDHRKGFDILKEADVKIELKPKMIETFNEEKNKNVKTEFYNKWVRDEKRLSFERTDFYPYEEECPNNIYNLFDGFEAEKHMHLMKNISIEQRDKQIEPFINHIKILTNGDEKYFINWLGNIIQTPHIKQATTPLFRDKGNFLNSGGGTGKNLFFDNFGKKLLGEKYYLTIATNDVLFNTFNEHLENKLLVCIEEAEGKANFTHFNTLKSNISQEKTLVNRKSIPKYEINDFTRYIFCSNNENPIPIDNNDRRFYCYDVNTKERGNAEYFIKLKNAFNDPLSVACFFDYLKTYNIYKTPIEYQNNRPITKTYIEIKRINAPNILKWLITLIKAHTKKDPKTNIYKLDESTERGISDLYDDFNNWLYSTKQPKNEISLNAFSRFLTSDEEIFTADNFNKSKSSNIMIKINLQNIKDKLIEKHYINKQINLNECGFLD